MAVIALTLSETKEYISSTDPAHPDNDNKDGTPTMFLLGTMPSRLNAMLKDNSTKFLVGSESENITADFSPHYAAFDRVRLGVRGWKNYQDASGSEVEFKTESISINGYKYKAITGEVMDRLPISLIQELSMALETFNTPAAEDLKISGE